MTAQLWIDTAADRTVELGGTLPLYAAFAEMVRAAGGDRQARADYPDLFGVLDQVEDQDDADPEWLAAVRAQAAAFLKKHAAKLDAHAAWVLGQLVHEG